MLWRLGRRRGSRRLIFLSALAALLVFAPQAAATPPDIQVTIFGTLGSNGWYRSNVTVNWDVTGEENSSGCDARTLTADTAGTKITCTATSGGGLEESIKSVTVKLDKTPPSAAPIAARPPDANGWYNRPLTVTFSGADPMSGLQGCSSVQYAGPDNVSAVVAGTCQDLAGNSTPVSFGFKYDATAPKVFAVATKRGNRSVLISWRASSDTQKVEILRAPGRGGAGESVIRPGSLTLYRDTGLVVGRKYEYRVAGMDEAGNRAEQKADVVATGPLLSPVSGERVTAPPYLIWTAVKKASYYNVQLVRGQKVLSAWPARPGFRLRRTWSYNGRRYRLRPGVYRWYVWPGYGKIAAAKYGRLLGSSTFVVTS